VARLPVLAALLRSQGWLGRQAAAQQACHQRWLA
jgi:hypothetical protein